MFDKELFRKSFYGLITFKIGSLSGSKIYVGAKEFAFNFDRTNEEQMKLIADVLFDFYEAIERDFRTNEENEKLRDFNSLITILNNYKDN